jgi:histidinol dehydrogenase
MLLRVLDLRGMEPPFADVLPRPDAPGADVHAAVARILAEVQAEGDAAVVRRSAKFDRVDLARGLRVPSCAW